MAERGTFRSTDHARKLGRFDGLRWGNITPTDFDFAVDFQGRLFVYAEAKYGETALPTGQRIILERQCDAMHMPPASVAVGFIVSHWERGDFYFKDTIITSYRWAGAWKIPTRLQTLDEGIAHFRAKIFGPESAPVAPVAPLAPPSAQSHQEWVADYERAERAS